MMFDPTITTGNLITLGGFALMAIVGWTRMEFMQKTTIEQLRSVNDRQTIDAKIAAEYRAEVTKSLQATALLNQETALTLKSLARDVERLSKDVERLQEKINSAPDVERLSEQVKRIHEKLDAP